MTREQAITAILVGYKKTEALIKDGYRLFGTGEMGISNTHYLGCCHCGSSRSQSRRRHRLWSWSDSGYEDS